MRLLELMAAACVLALGAWLIYSTMAPRAAGIDDGIFVPVEESPSPPPDAVVEMPALTYLHIHIVQDGRTVLEGDVKEGEEVEGLPRGLSAQSGTLRWKNRRTGLPCIFYYVGPVAVHVEARHAQVDYATPTTGTELEVSP